MTETKARDQIVALGLSMYERGLSFGSAGNLSVRLERGWSQLRVAELLCG